MSSHNHKSKSNNSIISILLVLSLLTTAPIFSQDISKFGKVSKEELQLTDFPEAPYADAVYLFDVGKGRITDDFMLILKRHVRIKILTEEGKEEANVRIRYWHEDKVSSLKAHTITPAGKKIKLKEIFDEKEGKWKYKVFTIPGVEVGSILEFQYELSTEYLTYLEPWLFQHSEFTKLSQYSMIIPPGFAYNVFFSNIADVETSEDIIIEPGKKLAKYTWKVENLPPVKEEPYMGTPKDYMATLYFQLISFKNQWVYHKWINSWEELVKKMGEHYEPFLDEKNQLKDILTVSYESKLDTAKVLYNYVREKIASNSRGGRYAEKRPREILKDMEGTGLEKNLLLINLLRTAGIEAYPLMISTRSHGKLFENTPDLNQFDYALAYFKIGYKSYILDSHRKYCPFELLPTYNLVERGLLIDEGDGKFINLPLPKGINMTYYSTEAALSEEGNLTATSQLRFEDYKGYFARDEILDSGEEEFVKKTLNERFGEVEIDSFKIEGKEQIDAPLHVTVSYRVKNFAQITGDMLYSGLPTIDQQKSNPFKSENRYTPVEFPYQNAYTDIVNFKLPAGFKVTELPENILRRGKDLTFAITFTADDTLIQIQRQYLRYETTFAVSEYRDLRNYFDFMIQADQNQIVATRQITALEMNNQ